MEKWREELYNSEYGDYLSHHGVKGMKWGVRRYDRLANRYAERGNTKKAEYYARKRDIKSGRMKIGKGDMGVTRSAKNDWNTMTDKEFLRKYKTSKGTYARRVAKSGDPYKEGLKRRGITSAKHVSRYNDLAKRQQNLLDKDYIKKNYANTREGSSKYEADYKKFMDDYNSLMKEVRRQKKGR